MFPDPVQREVFGVASPELSPHGLDIPSTPPATDTPSDKRDWQGDPRRSLQGGERQCLCC